MESGHKAQGVRLKAKTDCSVVERTWALIVFLLDSGFWLLDSLLADSHLAVTGSY